jgi:hypothetical protein
MPHCTRPHSPSADQHNTSSASSELNGGKPAQELIDAAVAIVTCYENFIHSSFPAGTRFRTSSSERDGYLQRFHGVAATRQRWRPGDTAAQRPSLYASFTSLRNHGQQHPTVVGLRSSAPKSSAPMAYILR